MINSCAFETSMHKSGEILTIGCLRPREDTFCLIEQDLVLNKMAQVLYICSHQIGTYINLIHRG